MENCQTNNVKNKSRLNGHYFFKQIQNSSPKLSQNTSNNHFPFATEKDSFLKYASSVFQLGIDQQNKNCQHEVYQQSELINPSNSLLQKYQQIKQQAKKDQQAIIAEKIFPHNRFMMKKVPNEIEKKYSYLKVEAFFKILNEFVKNRENNKKIQFQADKYSWTAASKNQVPQSFIDILIHSSTQLQNNSFGHNDQKKYCQKIEKMLKKDCFNRLKQIGCRKFINDTEKKYFYKKNQKQSASPLSNKMQYFSIQEPIQFYQSQNNHHFHKIQHKSPTNLQIGSSLTSLDQISYKQQQEIFKNNFNYEFGSKFEYNQKKQLGTQQIVGSLTYKVLMIEQECFKIMIEYSKQGYFTNKTKTWYFENNLIKQNQCAQPLIRTLNKIVLKKKFRHLKQYSYDPIKFDSNILTLSKSTQKNSKIKVYRNSIKIPCSSSDSNKKLNIRKIYSQQTQKYYYHYKPDHAYRQNEELDNNQHKVISSQIIQNFDFNELKSKDLLSGISQLENNNNYQSINFQNQNYFDNQRQSASIISSNSNGKKMAFTNKIKKKSLITGNNSSNIINTGQKNHNLDQQNQAQNYLNQNYLYSHQNRQTFSQAQTINSKNSLNSKKSFQSQYQLTSGNITPKQLQNSLSDRKLISKHNSCHHAVLSKPNKNIIYDNDNKWNQQDVQSYRYTATQQQSDEQIPTQKIIRSNTNTIKKHINTSQNSKNSKTNKQPHQYYKSLQKDNQNAQASSSTSMFKKQTIKIKPALSTKLFQNEIRRYLIVRTNLYQLPLIHLIEQNSELGQKKMAKYYHQMADSDSNGLFRNTNSVNGQIFRRQNDEDLSLNQKDMRLIMSTQNRIRQIIGTKNDHRKQCHLRDAAKLDQVKLNQASLSQNKNTNSKTNFTNDYFKDDYKEFIINKQKNKIHHNKLQSNLNGNKKNRNVTEKIENYYISDINNKHLKSPNIKINPVSQKNLTNQSNIMNPHSFNVYEDKNDIRCQLLKRNKSQSYIAKQSFMIVDPTQSTINHHNIVQKKFNCQSSHHPHPRIRPLLLSKSGQSKISQSSSNGHKLKIKKNNNPVVYYADQKNKNGNQYDNGSPFSVNKKQILKGQALTAQRLAIKNNDFTPNQMRVKSLSPSNYTNLIQTTEKEANFLIKQQKLSKRSFYQTGTSGIKSSNMVAKNQNPSMNNINLNPNYAPIKHQFALENRAPSSLSIQRQNIHSIYIKQPSNFVPQETNGKIKSVRLPSNSIQIKNSIQINQQSSRFVVNSNMQFNTKQQKSLFTPTDSNFSNNHRTPSMMSPSHSNSINKVVNFGYRNNNSSPSSSYNKKFFQPNNHFLKKQQKSNNNQRPQQSLDRPSSILSTHSKQSKQKRRSHQGGVSPLPLDAQRQQHIISIAHRNPNLISKPQNMFVQSKMVGSPRNYQAQQSQNGISIGLGGTRENIVKSQNMSNNVITHYQSPSSPQNHNKSRNKRGINILLTQDGLSRNSSIHNDRYNGIHNSQEVAQKRPKSISSQKIHITLMKK